LPDEPFQESLSFYDLLGLQYSPFNYISTEVLFEHKAD
jgi:hypothetical protein